MPKPWCKPPWPRPEYPPPNYPSCHPSRYLVRPMTTPIKVTHVRNINAQFALVVSIRSSRYIFCSTNDYSVAFARAYNLKTHMATHDPHRLKPHVCPHHTCGRSFSRKHDLGRHLVSIHRDDPLPSTHPSNAAKKSIGVDKGPRGWCERCGRGWVGKERDCDCHVK